MNKRAATAERIHPDSRAAWRAWLAEHHRRRQGVWLVSYKQATGKLRMSYDDAVDEAVCWGWIDSKINGLDGERSMLWFAPRKPGTGWSRVNQLRVERLIAGGLMQPPGRAKVEAAKADGSWSALDEVERLTVPPDLAFALAGFPRATAHFAAFPRSARRGILEWIQAARKAETRAARVRETAQLAEDNIRANQWPRTRAGG